MGDKNQTNVAFQCKVTIAKEVFQGSIAYQSNQMMLGASWENTQHHTLELQSLVQDIGVTLPSFLDWSITLKQIVLLYAAKDSIIQLSIQDDKQSLLLLAANLKDKIYCLRLQTQSSFSLNTLPFIGKFFTASDNICLKMLQVAYTKQGMKVEYVLDVNLLSFSKAFGDEPKSSPQNYIENKKDVDDPLPTNKPSKNWMELKKKIGPIYIRRVATEFKNGSIQVLVDASFTISIVTCSFIELYLNAKLSKGFSFDFGVKGIAITLDKPPLYISGGLYVVNPGRLYNGEVEIRYSKFSFLALGSYGLTESNKVSIFLYLMLKYPFGGPPCFFLTGIVAGFGVNRKLHLPTIDKVKEFPFLSAAMGKHKSLNANTSAADALSTLSDVIEPMDGQNFICAGITFTSFGMVESIAVISVSFGAKLEISLLGLSEIVMPSKESEPIAYASLALRVVFAPDDGTLQIEGALSKDSYLFSRDCHMQGGFAFYNWFKGEHQGDFVICIGGYHPSYKKKSHYPSVDRVGIYWNISEGLSLKAEAYFALTPNALMAGGHLELDYVNGNLKAWCHAIADFLIEWKPFHYDIAIGVSLGASYRIDFLFIHTTLTIELSANLHIWGPEFSGYIHIKWFIISFTIYFNSASNQIANRLSWTNFQEDFLPDFKKDSTSSFSSGDHLVRVQALQGKLSQRKLVSLYRHEEVNMLYVCASSFQLYVESAMPCSKINLYRTNALQSSIVFGIVPMGLTSVESILEIHMYQWIPNKTSFEKQEVQLYGRVSLSNVASALWNTRKPSLDDGMIQNAMMGYTFEGIKTFGERIPLTSWYTLEQLQKNEEYHCPTHYKWLNVSDYKQEGDIHTVMISHSDKRTCWLQQLSCFSIRKESEIYVEHFIKHADKLMNSPVVMHVMGNDLEEI